MYALSAMMGNKDIIIIIMLIRDAVIAMKSMVAKD